MNIWKVSIISLPMIALVGCVTSLAVAPDVANARGNEIWSLDKLPSLSGYRYISISHLNPDRPVRANTEQHFVKIAVGNIGGWRWRIQMEPDLLSSWQKWKDYEGIDKLYKKFGRNATNHQLPAYPGVVSWHESFKRFRTIMEMLIGRPIPPMNVAVDFVEKDSTVRQWTIRYNKHAIPVKFYFRFPNGTGDSRAINHQRASAIGTMFQTLAHEYFHAIVDEGVVSMPNQITNEAVASSFDLCVTAAMAGSIGIVSLNLPSSVPFPPRFPTALELRERINKRGQSPAGAMLAKLNAFSFLKRRSVGDSKGKNAFLSLCRAMIQHPHDLTKSFYPADDVRPLVYFRARPADQM